MGIPPTSQLSNPAVALSTGPISRSLLNHPQPTDQLLIRCPQRRSRPVASPHSPGPSNPVPIRKNDPGSGAPTEILSESAPPLQFPLLELQIPMCIVLPLVSDSEMN